MFKRGDKVRKKESMWEGLSSYPVLDKYQTLTVRTYKELHMDYPAISFEETGSYEWDSQYFELVVDDFVVPNTSSGMSHEEMLNITPKSFQGIAKPILEERKVGKVKMHLVDEGFPNAMMELGRMMGWAEEHKGYKPNDFKNLPNAEVEFSAAATRHRLKGFMQKAEGVPAIDRVDEESGISHLCHAAFNILAELELVLTGKIR